MDFKMFVLFATMTDLMTAVGSMAPGYTPACYLGWEFWRGACYKVFNNKQHWNRSGTTCVENGGNLLEFAGREEEEHVLTLLSSAEEFWIGLHSEMNGTWRWRSGVDLNLPYFKALLGTVVSSLKSAKCGTLSSPSNGSLSTHDCQDHLPFICKAVPFDCTTHFDWHVSKSRHCLWFSDDTNTGSWRSVRQSCYSFVNSDLATFSTSDDASLLPTILRRNVSYWVGLNATPTFDLIWLNGVKETSSSRFKVAHGKNQSVTGGQCGGVTLISHDRLQWELDDCHTSKQFICERTAPKPVTTLGPTSTTVSTATATNGQNTTGSYPTTYRSTHNKNDLQTYTTVISDPGRGQSSDDVTAVAPTRPRKSSTVFSTTVSRENQNWFLQKLPKRLSAPAHLRFRRNHGHGWHWHTLRTRATLSPAKDCCVKHNIIICQHNSSYYSSLTSFRSCEEHTSGTFSTTAAAHVHITKSAPISFAVPPDSDGSSTSYTMLERTTETTTAITHTTEVASHLSSLHPDSGVLNTTMDSQLKRLCSGSDEQFNCLMEHIQDGDQTPEVMTHILHDLHQDLIRITNLKHPPFTKIIFENFFRMVNFFIEGSYSGHWHKYNLSLCDVLLIVEPFLDNNIDHLDHGEDIVKTYSHVDILIRRMKRDEMSSFTFDDHDGIGHIDYLTTSSTSFDDVAVAVVFMKVPVLHATLDNSNYTELVVSPILSLSAYTQGRQLSLTNGFTLNQTRIGIQRFNLTDNETDASPVSCAFWDNATRTWSTYGCTMTSMDNMTSHCSCNHTTNFAILMQVNYFELSARDRFALELITYIGCSVALITQVIAITVFTFVGSLNSERVYVHRNLCIAIVGAQVTFLAGIDAVDNRLVCAVVALVLHYCYTAVFIWMLVEGLHLYSKVVQVFGTERSRIIYYMTFGWGVPVILVTISAAADWEGYGTDHSCWLSTTRRTIWAFVGPALAIVIVNLVILAIVVRIVMSSTRKQGEFDHIRAGIKGALFLLPLLGLTWVFGLAAVNEDLVVFQYLFAIFNSLQGFFIFLFHCAFNTEVRQALRRLKEKRSLQKGDLSVSSGSHGATFPLSDAWAVRSDRSYPPYPSNQVAPLATTATTTTRLNSLSHSKESDDVECVYNKCVKEENEELSLMYI